MNEINTMSEAQDLFDDYLDEGWDPIEILGVTYPRGFLLRNADPIAYRSYILDFIDGVLEIDADDLIDDVDW